MAEGTSSANVDPGRTRREGVVTEWKRAHTAALVGLIALIFVVGLIPPNQVIPGFTAPEHGLVAWLIIVVLMMVCFVTIGHGTTGLWEGLLIDPPQQDVSLQVAAVLVDRSGTLRFPHGGDVQRP